MARIYAYGSSTVYGLWDSESTGFVGRLKATMFKESLKQEEIGLRRHHDVYNRGVTAQTIHDTLKMLEHDIAANTERAKKGHITIGIFLLGAIESAIKGGTDEHLVNPEDFEAAVHQLGQLCIDNAITPIFVGVPPINEAGTRPFTQSGDHYITEERKRYDDIVRTYAAKIDAPFVETWDALGGGDAVDQGIVSSDFLHVGSEGHRIIHDLVLAEIDEILLARRSATA